MVNDRLGHPTGDHYLEVLGNALASHCREGDLPCRYGGDEFAVLLPGAGQAETLAVAHRLHEAVDRLVWPGGPEAIPVTVSIGAVWSEGGATLLPVEDVLRRVDRCLYRAKGTQHAVVAEAL
jgi:diguanylate cyclase (GGDEF)-like protein